MVSQIWSGACELAKASHWSTGGRGSSNPVSAAAFSSRIRVGVERITMRIFPIGCVPIRMAGNGSFHSLTVSSATAIRRRLSPRGSRGSEMRYFGIGGRWIESRLIGPTSARGVGHRVVDLEDDALRPVLAVRLLVVLA